MRLLLSVLLVLLLVPGWSGEERLALPEPGFAMAAERVALDPDDPARRRLGALTYLGGVALRSEDPTFGGFSALVVAGDRFAMVSDGGNLLRFSMGADWRPRGARFGPLPTGPATGWDKRERDSEAMAFDPRTGKLWVAFENQNEIWRYGPGGGERWVAPRAMAEWPLNGGAESLARMPDGGFVVLGEGNGAALRFAGDPTEGARAFAFRYRPERGMSTADAAALPDGRLLVLERGFSAPWNWRNRIALVGRGAIRPGARLRGRTVARLGAPVLHDNFEGLAVTREGGATILWVLSDDNLLPIQRTLLLKFRLDG